MSHVSSLSKSSFPLRGTLARLDTNGDGVLSREELAASQTPGILGEDSNADGLDRSQAALGSIIATLMQTPATGGLATSTTSVTPPGVGVSMGVPTDPDMQVAMDAYRGTYGQYDLSDIAA
jgi:hypothetical protein